MTTIELDLRYFVRIPKALTGARAEGYITHWMYEIMCYLHEKADRHTGVKREFDPDDFIEWLPSDDPENPRPSRRTVQRYVKGLAEAGWIISGYRKGRKRPYPVRICNFRPVNVKDADEGADEDAEKVLINRSELKHWKETSAYQGAEEDADEDVEQTLSRRCEGAEKAASTSDSSDAHPRSNAAQAGGQNNAYAQATAPSLMMSLPRIAAPILQKTFMSPRNLREKFSLIEEAYGVTVVEDDFGKWCLEVKDNPPKYPVTAYLKLIDSRLGKTPLEPHANTKEPIIAEIGALSYKMTGVLPSTRSIANLRLSYEADEIKAALTEYASSLDAKEYKPGMKTFFTEGGASAVIYARRQRKGEAESNGAKPKEQVK